MRFKLNDNVTTCLHLEANCLCKVETGGHFFHTSKHIKQRRKKNIEKNNVDI